MPLAFHAIREDTPGSKWQAQFEALWPNYRTWFLSQGHRARPGYRTCLKNLRDHLPELVPLYESLVELAGGGDIAARFLSLYNPPPYMTGCSQAVWTRNTTHLVRNYDFSPKLFDGTLFYTTWNRPVIAVTDCTWGILDGINDAGLIASLAFGGRQVIGEGFGIPLLLRYILEFCDNTQEATRALTRIPIHMAYNVTLVDAHNDIATLYLSPDRDPIITHAPLCTNHQEEIEWERYAAFTQTLERHDFLQRRLDDPTETPARFLKRFLRPPLYKTQYERACGTLYTAVYSPSSKTAEYHWPTTHTPLKQSFTAFTEGKTFIRLGDPTPKSRSKIM